MSADPECARCILRRSDDARIDFDATGLCNHCRAYDAFFAARASAPPRSLASLVAGLRGAGRGREYDCVVGVSGGLDSSYAAYLARQQGLRALAVHLDNGWNSELAVGNIERLCKGLGLDLFTHVIAWNEFRDLQLAYLRASVVDIEAITDHAIMACLHRVARSRGIRHILTGESPATEGFLPPGWVHPKNDLMNIRAIHRRYGRLPLRTFPTLGLVRKAWDTRVLGLRVVPILDYVPYVKQEAKQVLTRELGFRDYGGKHYESVFTRFYQAYILPRKFGIDKRRSHLSTLICAGQMTREQALREIEAEPYPAELLRREREFVLKKLGLGEAEFEELMRAPARPHTDFASYLWFYRALRPLVVWARRIRSAA